MNRWRDKGVVAGCNGVRIKVYSILYSVNQCNHHHLHESIRF